MVVYCLGVAGRRQLYPADIFAWYVSASRSGNAGFIRRRKIVRLKFINGPIKTIKITGDYIIALGKEIIVESLKKGLAIRN